MNEDKENYDDEYDETYNEYDYGDSVDYEDYEENDKISLQKELIAIVKANPALWDKKQRSYSGKNFNKKLAWASVADLLEDMSGSDAEKEFYKIRQRYGRERRKMVMSLKGKSGQGAQPTYIPTWELYNVCDSFLRQAVVPRKTSSNYIKKMDESASNFSSMFKIVVPKNVTVPHVITSTQVSSDNWTSDFSSLSSHETSSESTTESPKTSFQSPTQEAQLRFKKQSQKSEKPNVIQEIRQASTSQAKTVPPPDTFNKKKEKDE